MENNVERNQDNGRGMFYAVIGVATLIITIIGATFAYLTATTNSAPNAVTAGGAEIKLSYSDVKTGLKTDMIPIDESLQQFAKGTFTPTGGTQHTFVGIDDVDCKDVNGNNICSVYQFTVTNNTAVAVSQKVFVRMTPNINTFTNMHYAVFKGTEAQILADGKPGFDVDGAAVTSTSTEDTDAARKFKIANKGDLVISDTALTKDNHNRITLEPLTQVLDQNESMTYTIVLWVHETGSAQDVDQGKNFAATISVDTGDAGTGVTGVLVASS